nr:hypothetical protein [Vagococcus elongatus]
MNRSKKPKIKDNFLDKDKLLTFLECSKDNDRPYIYVLFRLLAFSGMRKMDCAIHIAAYSLKLVSRLNESKKGLDILHPNNNEYILM